MNEFNKINNLKYFCMYNKINTCNNILRIKMSYVKPSRIQYVKLILLKSTY